VRSCAGARSFVKGVGSYDFQVLRREPALWTNSFNGLCPMVTTYSVFLVTLPLLKEAASLDSAGICRLLHDNESTLDFSPTLLVARLLGRY